MNKIVFCLVASALVSQATTLTGLVSFSTTSAGNTTGEIWNTQGSDLAWNLYVTQAGSGLNGAFLNSGGAAGASINIDITTPGTYTFHYLAETGNSPQATYGLNLFFNGNNTGPGISVFAPVNGGAWSANGAATTRSLNGANVAGANTLTFIDGLTTVVLTDYSWYLGNSTALPQLDRVQAFNNIPSGGRLDDRGFIVLEVTGPGSVAPEPGSALLILTGLAALPLLGRRMARRD